MKLIKQSTLHFQDDKSDKVYEVDLCEVQGGKYVVNFRYGRRGGVLKEGTKTDLPVTLAEAEKIYDKLVASKTKRGYNDGGTSNSNSNTTSKSTSNSSTTAQEEAPELIHEEWTMTPEHLHAFLKLLQFHIDPNSTIPNTSNSTSTPSKGVPSGKEPTLNTIDTPPPPPPTTGGRQQPPKDDSVWGMLKRWIGNDDTPPPPPRRRANQPSRQPQQNQPAKQADPVSQLNRLIWRAGELRIKEALPLLLKVEIGQHDMTDYCLAWALGRLKDKSTADKLIAIGEHASTNKNASLSRIQKEAVTAYMNDREKAVVHTFELRQLPDKLIRIVQEKQIENFSDTLAELINDSENPNLIATLYLMSQHDTFIRKQLLKWAATSPFEGNGYFRGIRQLFKAAEFREDAEMLGLLAYRIQMADSNFESTQYIGRYVNGKYVRVADEIKKPDSQLAFSKATKEYLLRRCARVLRRKGALGDPSYVKMATGMLLPYKDSDQKNPFTKTYYQYIQQGGRWTSIKKTLRYSAFAPYIILNEILFTNSSRFEPSKKRNKWLFKSDYVESNGIPPEREEAFPELWDQMPNGLLHLLAESECEEVHRFAVKAATTNLTKLLPLVDSDFIRLLFQKEYAVTQHFALELAKAIYDPKNPDFDLVITLLDSSLEAARKLALSWAGDNTRPFLTNTSFVVRLLFIHHEEVVEWTKNNYPTIPNETDQAYTIIGQCLTRIMDSKADANETEKAQILVAGDHLTNHFTKALSSVNLHLVNDLLGHPLAEVQVFGAKILLNHETPVKDLPEDLLLGLINGESPELREVGVQLLGKLPPEELSKKEDLLLGLCLSAHAEVRQAVKPILADLGQKDKAFLDGFVKRLAPWLLRKEEHEGRDNDLLDLLTNHLKNHLSAIGKETTLNLIFSPRKTAHILGEHLLRHHTEAKDLTLRQIVKIGSNEMHAVRLWVWDFYKNNTPRIKYEAAEAVRLLDSRWDDSRDFAIGFFRNEFTDADWTPDILVSLCDSVNPMVQQFGKEMITQFFNEKDGEQYLLQLSQHPATELQQFATNYLSQFATGQTRNIHELTPYFTTVLSCINKSRVAKKRIFSFLQQEGSKSKEVAEIVAGVLARQSVTMAIGDKAKCIEIMRDLQELWTDLEVPLERVEWDDYPTILEK